MWYDRVQWWVILVGAKIGKAQCMPNSLIICGPVVDCGYRVQCGVHWDGLGGWNWGGGRRKGGIHAALRYAPSECGMHWIILPWTRLDTTFVLN